MKFKVSSQGSAPDLRGFWRSVLVAQDGTQVEIRRPESEWMRESWAVSDEVDIPLTPGGQPDLATLPGDARELPPASKDEVYRMWNSPHWMISL